MERSGLAEAVRRTPFLPLLLATVVLLVAAGCAGEEIETPDWAKRQLATFERDPIAQFRAPGTELKEQTGRPAGTKRGWLSDDSWSTTFSASFVMNGEPGITVEAYISAANGAGWRLLEVHCQRQALFVTAVFGKDIPGFPGGSAVLSTVVARPQERELRLELDANHAPPDPPAPRAPACLVVTSTACEAWTRPIPGVSPGRPRPPEPPRSSAPWCHPKRSGPSSRR